MSSSAARNTSINCMLTIYSISKHFYALKDDWQLYSKKETSSLIFAICTQNKTFTDTCSGCACSRAMNTTLPLPALLLLVITIKDARHPALAQVVLAFCYTMVRRLTGARHNSSLQIKGMSNSKWSREVISWQSLSGVSWSFFLVRGLGDHTFLWECEGRGRGEKNLNNNFKEHKLFSWVFVKCKTFWKSNFTPFLKTRPSKMKYCKCTNLILVSHSIANNYLIPWILVKGFSLHRKRLAVPVAFASG